MVKGNLSSLKRKKLQIEQEGYLLDCWIGSYRPAGTAKGNNLYYHLRSKKPLANGKYSQHLTTKDIGAVTRLVENGRKLKKISKEIAYLENHKQPKRAVLTSSASDEWYTPLEYIELARLVMGSINMDPASNAIAQQWIKAAIYYTAKQNGLAQEWKGCVWLNPPYGGQVSQWVEKAIEEHKKGNVSQAILLVRPAAGSAWYQRLSALYPCCTLHKRIKFIDAKNEQQKSPVHGNVFFYIGDRIDTFRAHFSTIGVVTKPI